MKKIRNGSSFFIGLLVGFLAMFAIDFFWEREMQKNENTEIENEIYSESAHKEIPKESGQKHPKMKSDTVKKILEKIENNEKIETEDVKILQVPTEELGELNSDETTIAKDEFLGSKRILIKRVQGGDSAEMVEFLVEFWVSPINYKGYKRNDKRIIVFGFNMDSELNLMLVGDSLWLEHKNQRFLLKKSQEFHRFSSLKNSESKSMAALIVE